MRFYVVNCHNKVKDYIWVENKRWEMSLWTAAYLLSDVNESGNKIILLNDFFSEKIRFFL